MCIHLLLFFFFSSRRRHTRCALVTGVQTCALPIFSRARVTALCSGDGWLEKGANLIFFGPPGGGKTHLAAAIGLVLIENGWRVLFTRTSDLVQKLPVARRELALESPLSTIDNSHLMFLADLASESGAQQTYHVN